MAQFDVYPNPDGEGYVVDVQSNLFDDYGTRVVIPLLPPVIAPKPVNHLNPEFDIGGEPFTFHPHFVATVPTQVLGKACASLATHDYTISNAINMMLKGF